MIRIFSSEKFAPWLLLVVLLLGAWLHLPNLTSGTPSREKNSLLFSSEAELKKWIPPMIEARKEWYSLWQDILNPEKSLKETFKKMSYFGVKPKTFEPLGAKEIMHGMRGYLIGTRNSDEQNTLRAIRNFDPTKSGFRPEPTTIYGGFYYYSCGAALFFLKSIGWLRLSPDVEFYFEHPEETQKIYLTIRALGGVSALVVALLLYFFVKRIMDKNSAFLTMLFFLCSPVLVSYSHNARAHHYGMLWLVCGLYFFCKNVETPLFRNYLLGGIFLGFSAGSILVNSVCAIIPFVVEVVRNDGQLLSSLRYRRLWLSFGIIVLITALTNHHLFLDYQRFQRFFMAVMEFQESYGEKYGSLRFHNWMPFLKDSFMNHLHWSILPLLLAGFFSSLKAEKKVLQICSITFIVLFLQNLFILRHPGVTARNMPFIAILIVAGSGFLLKTIKPEFKFLVIIYTAAGLFLSTLQSIYHRNLVNGPDNLILAGRWINSEIPKGESIGIVNAEFTQVSFPPIHFLEYKLIHFPSPAAPASFSAEQLPTYVVWQDNQHPLLKDHYRQIQTWKQNNQLLGIKFKNTTTDSSNVDLFVYKKI